MNADSESSGSEKREGHSRRPGYYRSFQGRERNNYRERHYNPVNSEYNPNYFQEDSGYANNLNYNRGSHTRNFNSTNVKSNYQGSSKYSNSRQQYNSGSYSNRSYPNEYNKDNQSLNNSFFNRDQENVEQHVSSSMSNASQRGAIVGGRYIRKHINKSQPNNSQAYNDPHSSVKTSSDRNIQKEHYSSQAYNDPHSSVKTNSDRNIQKEHYSSHNYDSKYSHHNSKSEKQVRKNESQRDRDASYYASSDSTYQSKSNDKKSKNTYPYVDNYANSYQNSAVTDKSSYKKSYSQKPFLAKSGSCDDDKATQRELLISRLHKGECECLVCCELIRSRDQIWHCLSCYHVFHLRCIKKWARSPAAAVEDGSWRCPACQSLTSKVPFNYFCFCGKNKNPEINYHLTPHSCGEICDRLRPDCTHHCKELCHPGPCPPCVVVIQKSCPCGKSVQTLPCNQAMETSCQNVCDKLLNCGVHRCKSLCHVDKCLPCEEIVVQKCYCGKSEREVDCTEETASCFTYSCGNICEKNLNCGHHTCKSVCHSGACNLCQLSVERITSCCCGKSRIANLVSSGKAQERLSCLDPVPVCGSVCGRKLLCGPKGNEHSCQVLCHESECPPCLLTTSLKCRCGAFTKEFPCAEITDSFIYTCEKRCNRRKDCGRHKCLNNCCVNFEHKCELVCNKKLSCGLHNCQETCHGGNCPTCWNVSFDELRCHCGESVLYPPIACGTKPPECSKPCIRQHTCDHEVKHSCHSDANCPPCTSLTTKWCYGNHKQCGPVMCFLDGVSCGMPCQKSLPCGRHKCKLTCHPGDCLKESEKCTQACLTPRPSCGHPCNHPCHDGPCPETPCKTQVTSNCPCGHRSETTTCYDSSKSYRLLSSTMLATKMQEIKEGQSVNLSDVLGKKSKNNKLQCNEECAVIERNKRLAVALQIQNPDLSASPGPPSYSEFLKDEAKKNPQLVSDVYEKLSNLVQLAKQSKQKCRSHSFAPMNRDQRRVVHELAEFFGCETQSYDEEPKRNVVATAYKNRCWLPFSNIMAIVQRDKGIRKGPTPVISQRDPKAATAAAPVSNPTASGTAQKKKIDYFDYKE